jgi:cytochrome c-type biogenesis protein CcmH/NrfG
MRKQQQSVPETTGSWTTREAYLLAAVCLLVGVALGYLIRGSSAPPAVAASTAPATVPAAAPANPLVAAGDLDSMAAPLKAALRKDPNNFDVLVQLGNLYFDKQVFAPAIEYYGRALELHPKDVNVRTDLGTAYWYSGAPQEAVAEYKQALAVDPGHPQTLFNMGVVYKDGLKDPADAVAAWEKLLRLHPDHPDRQRVLGMIEAAKKQKS